MRRMSKSALGVARETLAAGRAALPEYGSRVSRRDYTPPQLFALLVLRQFLRTDYRGVVVLVAEWSELRCALGLTKVPHYGCKLHLRSDGYFGVGGWSASPWRWYVNLANGDMVAGQDIFAGRNISAAGRVYASGFECVSAAMGVQDVGMIVQARRADAFGFVNVTYTPGSTIGGGSLWIENSTTTLPGTWRCLGFSPPYSLDEGATTSWQLALWQRIA